MTEKQQRRLYFPAWGACAAANDWKMARGRLVANLEQQVAQFEQWPDPAGTTVASVLKMADAQARQEHRAVNADDLRHSCNYLVAHTFSSQKLKNAQVTRVVNLFRLLTDPWDLQAVMDWLNPDAAGAAAYVDFMRKLAHEGVLRAISENAFQTPDWESLSMERLQWLCRQLKSRRPRPSERILDPELEPF